MRGNVIVPRRRCGEDRLEKLMQIHGSVRSNLLSAIASAKRWRGRAIHAETADHWRRLADYGRVVARQPYGEAVSDLVAELESEMAHVRVA